ncbi:MAG: aromatic ring-hydroxylating oxygenase subunit alpha, partial [Gammaproteobacteria bacterium]
TVLDLIRGHFVHHATSRAGGKTMSGSEIPLYAYEPDRIEALRESYRHGGPLPRAFYVTPEVFAADMDRIWRRYWLYAGHSCQIPAPGDWMTWAVGYDRVVLVRGKDGTVRAFHNTCRHRGSRVCMGERGHSKLLVCPYHAWTYELDGRLRTQTEREFGVHPSKLGLHPVPLEDLGGLLFVALGDNPQDFKQAAADIKTKMIHQGLDEAKLAAAKSYTVQANWKLIFENNRECYHCAHAHPEYIQGTYDIQRFKPHLVQKVEEQTVLAAQRFEGLGLGEAMAASDMTGPYWRAARTPLAEGWRTQSLDGTPVAPLMGTFRARDEWSMGTLRTTVFPNFWQHASDDHAVATRITPLDATTSRTDVFWFVHKDAVEGKDYVLDRLMPFWQRTSEQDWSICEANQAGVLSPRYEPGPYARAMERNVQHFVDWYLGALAGPRKGAKRARLRTVGAKDSRA